MIQRQMKPKLLYIPVIEMTTKLIAEYLPVKDLSKPAENGRGAVWPGLDSAMSSFGILFSSDSFVSFLAFVYTRLCFTSGESALDLIWESALEWNGGRHLLEWRSVLNLMGVGTDITSGSR